MTRYHNPALRQLADQQARYAPIDKRLEQMDRAEELITSLSAEETYGYQDLCERVTAFRPQAYPDMTISGSDAAHDLRLFVEDLSASVSLPAERAGEPVLTVDDVSKRYHVSTKTVDRWRKRGLVSRRFQFGNRSRIGFLNSSVERFVSEHGEEVARGSRFTQLSDSERHEIIDRARRLARFGTCPSEVSRQLSATFDRSPETIRYTLKQYDDDNPGQRVFPVSTDALSSERREELYNRFRQGASVDVLAKDYCRTRTNVYRIIAEVRAERLCGTPVAYMDSPDFHQSNADRLILGPAPATEKKQGRLKAPAGLPAYLASLYTMPLLTREEEVYHFRRMNYLKHRASLLQKKINQSRPRATDLDELERLIDEANTVKKFLIRSNLRLVVSIAKRHLQPSMNFFEMVSDGNVSLMRAIEKFDYTKGNKFSTYATWAIMKNFARSIPAEHTQRDRFRTGNDEVFHASPDSRGSQWMDESTNARQREAINTILEQLDERERSILQHRYGLERGTEPLTLEQVGSRFGVTKERIRQIEARALQKLRKIASEEKLEIPGV
jgi:RNA polymerase sigma factor (sigma-70 family)